MNKKDLLTIGTVVRVHKISFSEHVYDKQSHHNADLVIKKIKPRYELGIVVGGTYLRPGKVSYSYEDGNYFTSKGPSPFVYLVRPAYTMKPMKVMPEDLEVYLEPLEKDHIIPFSGSAFQWDRNAREELAEIMKTVSRDEKGRWK